MEGAGVLEAPGGEVEAAADEGGDGGFDVAAAGVGVDAGDLFNALGVLGADLVGFGFQLAATDGAFDDVERLGEGDAFFFGNGVGHPRTSDKAALLHGE